MNDGISTHTLNTISALKIDLEDDECLLKSEVDLLKQCDMEEIKSKTKLSTSFKIIEENHLDRIGSLFDKYVSYYTKNVLGINYKFKRIHSWLTLNQNSSKHHSHIHPNSMISCVLYFDEEMTDNELSELILDLPGIHNTFTHFKFDLEIENLNSNNYTSYCFNPKTNRMFIFPSSLHHRTEICKSSEKRYCLGANYFISDMIKQNTLEEINICV